MDWCGFVGPRQEDMEEPTEPSSSHIAESQEEEEDLEKFGRRLPQQRAMMMFGGGAAQRCRVLRETLTKLGTHKDRQQYRAIAQENVARWEQEARKRAESGALGPRIRVERGDWGAVAQNLTKQYGKTFAVLNMANAYVAGGGYVEGMPAQEENMFRRTDCHFSIDATEFSQERDRYHADHTDLVNGRDGRVFLDTEHPRVCIRGPEDRDADDLGYAWLENDDIFPFYELRAAAVDLRRRGFFEPAECSKRVHAQLDTLRNAGIRHCVLSAFGCGAFLNPPEEVAVCYHDALREKLKDFDCVAFAIFYPGYGPDNFGPFDAALAPLCEASVE